MMIYDLFISYSTDCESEAKQIAKKAEQMGLNVFLATSSIVPGDEWESKIRNALRSCRELCVLVTNQNKSNRWIITEWSVAWFLEKRCTSILLKDVDVNDLDERLKRFQIGSFEQIDDFLSKLIERKVTILPIEKNQKFYNEFKNHNSIHETFFSPTQKSSPFIFHELIKISKKRLFIAGQNLYTLVVKYGKTNKQLIFDYLSKDSKNRLVQIMVCDPKYKNFTKAWMTTTTKKYKNDLNESISNLEVWMRDAQALNLNLEVKTISVVPITITFVDPDDEQGLLVLTPNAYQQYPDSRLFFSLFRSVHKQYFDVYWDIYTWRYLKDAKFIFNKGHFLTNVLSKMF